MRAGKLDRVITIQRFTSSLDEYGNPTGMVWTDVATMRAQLVQADTEEFIRGYGASDETTNIFRTRWLGGVTTADRVAYAGQFHNIKDMKEIGRQRGLEIRTVAQP